MRLALYQWAEHLLYSAAVAEYRVTFRDGSSVDISAKTAKFTEHGVEFTGRKHGQAPHELVAFMPYGDLRIVERLGGVR